MTAQTKDTGQVGTSFNIDDLRPEFEIMVNQSSDVLSFPDKCVIRYTDRTLNADGDTVQEQGFTAEVGAIDPSSIQDLGGLAVLKAKDGQPTFHHFHEIFLFPTVLGDEVSQRNAIVELGGTCLDDKCAMPQELKPGGMISGSIEPWIYEQLPAHVEFCQRR
ncbi:hypothetical protein RKLH11_3477 [Rhodobacteraceae bacterium KLH11]|nr:hypothetical protein RKLH11_3477 [Rhodobacteraceae bacterium KLH11]